MTGFPSALGVVRVHLRTGQVVASLPKPLFQARKLVADFTHEVVSEGESTATLLVFETDAGEDAWIRASDVVLVDVVPTEDPSA